MTEIFDDIRGLYDFQLPCEQLRPFIEFFSESSPAKTALAISGNPFEIEMFPSWTPTFWINLGMPYRLTTGHSNHNILPDQDILLLRDTPIIRHNHPADHIFTVKFYPGGLESVLGVSQTQLTGKIVSLREILSPYLLTQIKTAANQEKRITLLENHFLASLTHRQNPDHYAQLVRDSIGRFEDSGMLPNTTQLSECQFLHSRTINRYFHRVIGLPPKKYFSIIRARTALTGYLADRIKFAPDAYGYYDRSHFYKAVRQFTGRRLAG